MEELEWGFDVVGREDFLKQVGGDFGGGWEGW